MPITPPTGSFFHADPQWRPCSPPESTSWACSSGPSSVSRPSIRSMEWTRPVGHGGGIDRATTKLGLANMPYNLKRITGAKAELRPLDGGEPRDHGRHGCQAPIQEQQTPQAHHAAGLPYSTNGPSPRRPISRLPRPMPCSGPVLAATPLALMSELGKLDQPPESPLRCPDRPRQATQACPHRADAQNAHHPECDDEDQDDGESQKQGATHKGC
jgi:hypothetical protein